MEKKIKMNYTRIELADYFNCDRRTLYNKLKKLDIKVERGFLTIYQIHLICDQLGYPKPIPGREHLKPPVKIF
jgi:hypothetical protein